MDFLELRTVSFVSFLEGVVIGSIFIFYSRAKKRYPGTFELGLCIVLVAVGMLLFSFQKISGDFISYVVANTFIVAGLCLTPYGFRKFFAKDTFPFYYIALTAATFILNYYSVVIVWSPFIRQFTAFFVEILLFYESFYLLFYNEDPSVRSIARVASCIYLVLGSLFTFRLYLLVSSSGLNSPGIVTAVTSGQKILVGITLICGLVAIVSAYTFFILMVAFRLEAEVREGERKTGLYAAKLEAANAARSKFYSIISHDLQGPLGGMQELLTIMNEREGIPGDFMDYIKTLKETSESVTELLNGLLQWTRAEMGVIEVNPVVIKAGDVINRTIKIFDIKVKSKNIKILNEIPEELCVYADVSLFSTVVRNLVSNAIKFTGPGGTVKISAHLDESDRGRVVLKVSDTGMGMDEGILSKLFTINNQSIIKYGTAGEQGSGLGLLICREFAELLGGGISAESRAGQGSVFTLTLPAPPV